MKKQLKVIEIPKTGKKDWGGGAFTYAFVYSNKGNFLVKGYLREVEIYIGKNFSRYFVRLVLYNHGEHRDIMKFGDNCRLYLGEPKDKTTNGRGNWRYEVSPYGYHTNLNAIKLSFKRFPNKWIPEFDYLIDKYTKDIRLEDEY